MDRQQPQTLERDGKWSEERKREAVVWPNVISSVCFPGDKLLVCAEDTSNTERDDSCPQEEMHHFAQPSTAIIIQNW